MARWENDPYVTRTPPNRSTKNPYYGAAYYLTRDSGRLVIRYVDPDGDVTAYRAPATGSSAGLEMLMWLSLSATRLTTEVPTLNPEFRNDNGSNRVTFYCRRADAAFGFNTREAVNELVDDGWLTVVDRTETRWTVDMHDDLYDETFATLFEFSGDDDLTVVDSTGSALLSAYNAGPA
ncbi:MAG: hypothetical protein ABS81_07250 [Pseudonocardia sp. SCN 72-86]|nr:MAG: hypothetical protein ABS81_07250 [Pseudonocardia sp. SCN 72-86]